MVDIPAFGVMPFKLPGPRYEHEVTAETTPVREPKKTKRADKGPAIIASNRRGPHREPEIPMQLLAVRSPELEEVQYTPRGTGSFVDPLAVKETVVEEAPVRFSHIPTRMEMPEPAHEDTFISRALAPDEDELEAARNGMRWHWALEHRFMPPGSQWNETVWQGADRENQYIAQLLKQKKSEALNLGIPTAAEIRAREMYRGKVMDQYNKALAEYMKGHYDDPERAYEDFKKEVERLRGQYAKAGEVYGMDAFDPEDLRIPPPIAAPRNALATSPKMAELAKEHDFAGYVIDNLKEWVEDGRINNPEFLASGDARVFLDSVYERLMKAIKNSSNTMADAEKQRMQILLLPDNAMAKVKRNVIEFQKTLTQIMSSSAAKDWSQNKRGKINEIINDLGFNPETMDKASLASAMETLGGTLNKAMSNKDELPHDVATNLNAAKEAFDTFMKGMMLAADVAPHIVARMAYNVGKMNKRIYNNQAIRSGRATSDFLKSLEDISSQIPHDAMPTDELIENAPDYVGPTLNVRGKIKNTGNPQTGKEGSGNYIYDDEGGLK